MVGLLMAGKPGRPLKPKAVMLIRSRSALALASTRGPAPPRALSLSALALSSAARALATVWLPARASTITVSRRDDPSARHHGPMARVSGVRTTAEEAASPAMA